MSFAHRLILWLALLGMALHAPWPMMAHAQSAEGVIDHTICSAGGNRVVSSDDQVGPDEGASGYHQGLDDRLCCLLCADIGGTDAITHAPLVFLPHLSQLGFVRAVPQRNAYRPPGILRATARAPPLA